jgi:hypothetical protein
MWRSIEISSDPAAVGRQKQLHIIGDRVPRSASNGAWRWAKGLGTIVSRLFLPTNPHRKHAVHALSFCLRLHLPLEGTVESEEGGVRRVK